MLVAGVDSSTQSCTVVVVDAEDGRIAASGRAFHPRTFPPRSEQDPESWWRALIEALDACGSLPGRIKAVSVAAQQHGMVALDAEGRPAHPAKLWNDTESSPQARALEACFGREKLARLVGSVPGPAFTVTKAMWLRDEHPRSFEVVRRVVLPHDWLTWRLAGCPERATTDRGDASGTGWWSPGDGRYVAELLDHAGVDETWLSRVLGPGEVAGEATAAPLAGALLGPGTGDNMATALGLALAEGEAAVSFGTSGTVFAVSDKAVADATGAVCGFADGTGRYLPLVCTLNCTKVTDWAAGLLSLAPSELGALALTAAPGAGGVTVTPYFDGERTPQLPDATGAIEGLTASSSREEVARASFEGVACALVEGLDALEAAGVELEGPLVAVGGGASSPAYRQVLADLSQRQVVQPTWGADAAALGAARQAAAVANSVHPSEVPWPPPRHEAVARPSVPPGLAAGIRSRYRSFAGMAFRLPELRADGVTSGRDARVAQVAPPPR